MAAGHGHIVQIPLESRKDADPSSFVVSLPDGAATLLCVDRRLSAPRGSRLNPGGMHTRQFAGDDARTVSGHAPGFRRSAATSAVGPAAATDVQANGQPFCCRAPSDRQHTSAIAWPAQDSGPGRHARRKPRTASDGNALA